MRRSAVWSFVAAGVFALVAVQRFQRGDTAIAWLATALSIIDIVVGVLRLRRG